MSVRSSTGDVSYESTDGRKIEVYVCNDDDVMSWQVNMLSNSWEWQITSKLTVKEWCGDSAKVGWLDLNKWDQ